MEKLVSEITRKKEGHHRGVCNKHRYGSYRRFLVRMEDIPQIQETVTYLAVSFSYNGHPAYLFHTEYAAVRANRFHASTGTKTKDLSMYLHTTPDIKPQPAIMPYTA